MLINLTKEIAKRLKAARKAAGFKSARDFALAQNIALSTYAQHEAGKRSINAELIINYSKTFQINSYWLLTGDGDPYSGVIDKERKAILEHETYSISRNPLDKSKNYKLIDIELLKKILITADSSFSKDMLELPYPEVLDYCLDLYDVVSSLTADTMEKEKIINLTISSLRRGAVSETIKKSKIS